MGNISSATLLNEINSNQIEENVIKTCILNISILLIKQILSTFPTITYISNPVSLDAYIDNAINHPIQMDDTLTKGQQFVLALTIPIYMGGGFNILDKDPPLNITMSEPAMQYIYIYAYFCIIFAQLLTNPNYTIPSNAIINKISLTINSDYTYSPKRIQNEITTYDPKSYSTLMFVNYLQRIPNIHLNFSPTIYSQILSMITQLYSSPSLISSSTNQISIAKLFLQYLYQNQLYFEIFEHSYVEEHYLNKNQPPLFFAISLFSFIVPIVNKSLRTLIVSIGTIKSVSTETISPSSASVSSSPSPLSAPESLIM